MTHRIQSSFARNLTSAWLLASAIGVGVVTMTTDVQAGPRVSGKVGLDTSGMVCRNTTLSSVVGQLEKLCPSGLCSSRAINEAEAKLDRNSLLALTGTPEVHPCHVLFRFGRSQLTPSDMTDHAGATRCLDELAGLFAEASRSTPRAKVLVIGRSSKTGGDAMRNLNRSRNRVLSVANRLVAKGVPDSAIHLVYFGASSVFQLNCSADVGDLPVSDGALEAEGASTTQKDQLLNQSVQVVLWPCDGAAPAPVAAAPAPACTSSVVSTSAQWTGKVFLAAGDAGELFERYVATLEAASVPYDLARLVVQYVDAAGVLQTVSAPKYGLQEQMKGDQLRSLWPKALAKKVAALAVPSVTDIDFVCGASLPVVASSAKKHLGGCAITTAPSGGVASLAVLAATIAIAALWRSRRSR